MSPPGEKTPRGADSRLAKYPELHDPLWLRARIAEGLTYWQIAELIDFDCNKESVRRACKRHGVSTPWDRS